MAYSDKKLKTDIDYKPVPQVYNPAVDDFDVVKGRNGASYTELLDPSGNVVDLSTLLGSINDAAATSPEQSASVIALLKGILKERVIGGTTELDNLISTSPSYFINSDKVLTTFQAGHGFSGSASWNLNNTSEFCMGSQCVSLTTGGTGGTFQINKTGITAFDTTSKLVRVRLRVDNVAAIGNGGIRLQFATDSGFVNYYEWTIQPIALGLLTSGDWVSVTLTFQNAITGGSPTRSGITAIKILVGDPNTGVFTTTYVNSIELLPEASSGYVSITFDDGYESQFTKAKPIMESLGFRATIYPVTEYIGIPGRITELQLKNMHNVLGWEIGVHAYSAETHSLGYTGLTLSNLAIDINKSKDWLRSRGIYRGINTAAYPMGSFNTDVVNTCAKYFIGGRTTTSSTKEIPYPDNPLKLRAMSSISSYSGGSSASTIQTAIASAATNKSWLILVFHNVVDSAPASTSDCLVSDFQAIMNTLSSTSGIKVLPIGEVLRLPLSV